jgi:hypothetical protein
MKVDRSKKFILTDIVLTALLLLVGSACDRILANPPALSKPHPVDGTYFGVNLDWANLTLTKGNLALGH